MAYNDWRSPAAAAYRKLYDTAAWKKRRLHQLAIEPLCRMCLSSGETTAANVADHITQHKGDEGLFFHGDLQSLCKRCHDSRKQLIETTGFDPTVDANGYPIDPNHPARIGRE